MSALYERDGTTDASGRRRSGARRSLTPPVALASLVIALTMMLGSPPSSSADNGPNDVDVDPDSASHTIGDLVTLTAVLTAGTDAGSTGQVAFYFLPGSPNDTAAAPDYTCDGSTGLCSISYTATNAGVDVVCATSRSVPDGCAEPWATNDNTSTDVVQRIVSAPTPTPTPSPTPTPTPSPTPPPPTGWSFTVTPSTVVQGTTTDFVARVGHTSSGGNTGCSIVNVDAGFTILSAQVSDTSSGQDWTATFAGNRIWIVADGGSEKISHGEWVEVAVRATATQTGTLGWAATGSSTSTCTSEPSYLPGQTAWVTVTTANPTPVPTPVPAPVPTPEPTPVPTPDPTPVPTPVPAPVVQPPPPPPPDPAPVQPPPAPVTSSETATPRATPTSPAASEEHVIPLAEDRNAGAPPVTAPRALEPEPPLAAPAAPTPAPAEPDLLSQIVDAAADGIGRAVSPEAAAQVATTFGFPLALMMAAFLFLIVHDRVDRRDPKLHTAPRTFTDTVVRFKEEHEL